MNYNNENLLEMVELYAEEMGFIASEDEASERFDSEVMPSILEAHGKPGVAFDDEAMINEEFANWLDSLAKDGGDTPRTIRQLRIHRPVGLKEAEHHEHH